MKKFLAQVEVEVGNGKYYLKGLTKQQFDVAIAAIGTMKPSQEKKDE